jgi:hypothetical protein
MAQITLNSTGVASDGSLVLQSNGTTTAVTISTAQVATLAKDAVVQGVTVGRGAGAISTNTAVGASALAANTTGFNNAAFGQGALLTNTGGAFNTAIGRIALNLSTGDYNTAVGGNSLPSNTTGSNNTGVGAQALNLNTTASNNTAVGYQAGYSNTTGSENTFVGQGAGYANTTGVNNACFGRDSGSGLTTGLSNTFIGRSAGETVTTGTKNTILGRYTGNQGSLDIRTSSNYIVLSDGDGNPRMYFTNQGYPYCLGAYTNNGPASANLFVDSTGQIYRATSSLRYKRDVENATHGLTDVMALRPVTYKSKREDCGDTVYGGFIAEEVHALGLTEFVDYNEQGEPDAIHYGSMVSLLTKAIQELKAEFDAYKATHP